eukprot:g499.t1
MTPTNPSDLNDMGDNGTEKSLTYFYQETVSVLIELEPLGRDIEYFSDMYEDWLMKKRGTNRLEEKEKDPLYELMKPSILDYEQKIMELLTELKRQSDIYRRKKLKQEKNVDDTEILSFFSNTVTFELQKHCTSKWHGQMLRNMLEISLSYAQHLELNYIFKILSIEKLCREQTLSIENQIRSRLEQVMGNSEVLSKGSARNMQSEIHHLARKIDDLTFLCDYKEKCAKRREEQLLQRLLAKDEEKSMKLNSNETVSAYFDNINQIDELLSSFEDGAADHTEALRQLSILMKNVQKVADISKPPSSSRGTQTMVTGDMMKNGGTRSNNGMSDAEETQGDAFRSSMRGNKRGRDLMKTTLLVRKGANLFGSRSRNILPQFFKTFMNSMDIATKEEAKTKLLTEIELVDTIRNIYNDKYNSDEHCRNYNQKISNLPEFVYEWYLTNTGKTKEANVSLCRLIFTLQERENHHSLDMRRSASEILFTRLIGMSSRPLPSHLLHCFLECFHIVNEICGSQNADSSSTTAIDKVRRNEPVARSRSSTMKPQKENDNDTRIWIHKSDIISVVESVFQSNSVAAVRKDIDLKQLVDRTHCLLVKLTRNGKIEQYPTPIEQRDACLVQDFISASIQKGKSVADVFRKARSFAAGKRKGKTKTKGKDITYENFIAGINSLGIDLSTYSEDHETRLQMLLHTLDRKGRKKIDPFSKFGSSFFTRVDLVVDIDRFLQIIMDFIHTADQEWEARVRGTFKSGNEKWSKGDDPLLDFDDFYCLLKSSEGITDSLNKYEAAKIFRQLSNNGETDCIDFTSFLKALRSMSAW